MQVADNPDEPVSFEVGGFTEWAMLIFPAIRIDLNKSYRVALDLLSEMDGVLAENGLTRLPHYTVLHGVRQTSDEDLACVSQRISRETHR